MTDTFKPSNVLHIILWVVQILLAACLIWAAFTKWFSPPEKLAAMWPWTAQISPTLVKLTGLVDLLCGLGLVLPALFRIRPQLTPVAALGVVLLMICASVFHVSRGEASLIGFNIVIAALAAFVAWGRMMKARISAK